MVVKKMEHKNKFWWSHDTSIGAAAAGKLKDMFRNEARLNSDKIKPVTIDIIKLNLSEGIS